MTMRKLYQRPYGNMSMYTVYSNDMNSEQYIKRLNPFTGRFSSCVCGNLTL